VKLIGVLTTTLVLATAAGVAVITVRSLPDIQRYLKIRNM